MKTLTTDRRYASIVFASASDCQAGAAQAPLGESTLLVFLMD